MDSIKILFSLIGYQLKIALGIIYFILLRLYFNIEIIGYYGAIISFLMIFTFVIDLGFSLAHLKFFSEANNFKEKAICNGTFFFYRLIQFILCISLIILFFQLTSIYKDNVMIFYIFLTGYLLENFSSWFFSFLLISRKEVFKESMIITISTLLKIFLLVILASFFYSDIFLLANIFFYSNLILFILNLYFLKNFTFKLPNYDYIKKYFRYSSPFFIASISSYIINYLDILLIYIWFPINQVANYFTAKELYIYILTFFTSILNVLMITFVKNIKSGQYDKNKKLIKKIHKFLNLFIVPLVFLIILYASAIIVFFFGEDYKLMGVILSIFSLRLIITSLDIINTIQLRALGKVNYIAKVNILKELIVLILIIIFICPDFLNLGAIGAALGHLLADLIIFIITRPIIYKKYGLGFYWGAFRNLLTMLGIFILHLFINEVFNYPIYIIPILILFDLFLYFGINYIIKGFTKDELKYIFSTFNLKNIKESILQEFKNTF